MLLHWVSSTTSTLFLLCLLETFHKEELELKAKINWKFTTYTIHKQNINNIIIRKCFEPRSNLPWMRKIIWVIQVLRGTVVSDWRFDNLCGSHSQSHVVVLVSWKFKTLESHFFSCLQEANNPTDRLILLSKHLTILLHTKWLLYEPWRGEHQLFATRTKVTDKTKHLNTVFIKNTYIRPIDSSNNS